jgi:hypothetical protein
MYIVFYLDFARQLFKLSHGRTISGPTLARETQVLLEKWQDAAGTHPRRVPRVAPWTCPLLQVLAAIRFEVFTIPAPAP